MKPYDPLEKDEGVEVEETSQTEALIQTDVFQDEEYLLIKKELQPLLDYILFLTGKQEPKYRRFKQEIYQWNKMSEKEVLVS